jgi:hypothetical protein
MWADVQRNSNAAGDPRRRRIGSGDAHQSAHKGDAPPAKHIHGDLGEFLAARACECTPRFSDHDEWRRSLW